MRKFIFAAGILALAWILWLYTGRNHDATPTALHLDLVAEYGQACDRNIVGIQPFMDSRDYLSIARFQAKVKGYLDSAATKGLIRSNSVVLLPEYLGTWLVVAGEKASVAEANSLQGAMAVVLLSNPLRFLRSLIDGTGEKDRVAAAIFRMKAADMARGYGDSFKSLAKEFNVTIVAGSIVLPGPAVRDNEIHVDTSLPLYNTSFVFHPDGTIDRQIVRKSFPISSEIPFIDAAPIGELPAFDLPIGKTAVLVCADSWYPDSYQSAKALNAEVILVPSYCTGDQTMSRVWNGYDGGEMPGDVHVDDRGSIHEETAWVRYALPGRISSAGASKGMNVFLRGRLWDLGSDGQPFLIRDGALIEVNHVDRGGIWSLCVGK